MRQLIYIALFATLIFASCTSEDILGENDIKDDKNIEISLSISDYHVSNTTSRSTRSTHEGSVAEKQIDNLYLFLFDDEGDVVKYNVSGSSFASGTWSSEEAKVTLNITQVLAGTRDVYVVANYPSSMQGVLDAVTTISGLHSVVHNENTPWSTTLGTHILMSGYVIGHNFLTNRQLDNVPLTRAVAKLELNVKLKTERQSTPTIIEGIPGSGNTTTVNQYGYKFIDFDKNTYPFKQDPKSDDLASFGDWVNFTGTSGDVSSYTLTDGVVTDLKITTYLNERDRVDATSSRTSIELMLPYNSGGPLPPPEFGDETYILQLPANIERNTWYVYDIEI